MAITENQKDLVRLMIVETRADAAEMKSLAAMSDENILAQLAGWCTQTKSRDDTTLGLYNQIIALGG